VVHRPCIVGAVGRRNAANVELCAFAGVIIAWCSGLVPSVQLGGQNAANVEWRLAFAKMIVAWCIGPALSVQLGGQMPRVLNGV
jgi:hypothetical protein